MRDWYARNKQSALASAHRSRERRIEAIREYDRMRGRTEERLAEKRERERERRGSESAKASARRWRQENPEKIRAHAVLSYHITVGHIQRQPCEICGALRSEGHHEDYTRPLDVRWLCRRHHAETHRRYA